MLNKKKLNTPKRVPPKRRINKHTSQIDDTVITTKQRTFATIQQTNQYMDHKISTRTTHFSSKRDYLDQMQASKLSPFSSPNRSISARQNKSVSPTVVKQKSRKNKTKKTSIPDKNKDNKKTPTIIKKQLKTTKQRLENNNRVRAEFQNQFLKRMSKIQTISNKKITQLSQQEIQGSIRKHKRPIQIKQLKQIKLNDKKHSLFLQRKSKEKVIEDMHYKIKQKYRRMYPKLAQNQLKVLAAIVLVQRIWRQKKVKDIINDFLSPRIFHISYEEAIAKHLTENTKLHNQNIIDISRQVQDTMKTDKSIQLNFHTNFIMHQQFRNDIFTNKSQKQISKQKQKIQYITTPIKKQQSYNLKQLELSSELSEADSIKKTQRVLSYINMYREVTLMSKKSRKTKNKAKLNTFNLPESLSEKCLLDKLYHQGLKKIDRSLIGKKKVNESDSSFIFPWKSSQKIREQYMSPKKHEIVDLQQRFYTEVRDQDQVINNTNQNNKILQKQPIKPEQQTVGTIGLTAEYIINFIIQQFSQEFYNFSNKKCLKKKRKAPGIPISQNTINLYLNQFTKYVNQTYIGHIDTSLKKITPMSFLKIFRILPQENIFETSFQQSEISQNQQDQFSWPVLPNSAFFEYQPIYEQKIFIIKQDDQKYTNFLLGLIKIHNKCLVDCYSEYIEKQRIDSFVFPWDQQWLCGYSKNVSNKKLKGSINNNNQLEKSINNTKQSTIQPISTISPSHNSMILSKVIKSILKISTTNLGLLKSSRNRDLEQQQLNLLACLKQDYKNQGRQWNQYSQLLEIRLQITEDIIGMLWKEAVDEIYSCCC